MGPTALPARWLRWAAILSRARPRRQAPQILQPDLAAGDKSGYLFSISCKDKITANGVDRYNSYVVTAVPETVGKTGDRGFCSDQFGTLTADPAGGSSCSQPVQ